MTLDRFEQDAWEEARGTVCRNIEFDEPVKSETTGIFRDLARTALDVLKNSTDWTKS